MDKNKKFKLIGAGLGVGTMAALSSVIAVVAHKKFKENKAQNISEKNEYITGNIRKFGTLYLDDEKMKNPVDFIEFSDIPEYNGQKIEIGNSDGNNENMLSWVEIDDNAKKLLICDRNIIKGISWNELNKQNLIFGKVVMIEDKKYILRLLSGYSEKKNHKANEWDKYIVNTDKISGLPKNSAIDADINSKQDSEKKLNGENNKLWHWYKFSSFTQSEELQSEKFCIIRGFYATLYSSQSIKDLRYETVGYRPVLELVE
ncbi:hypothetical protein [Clostridium sp. BL-8]|uniref:hypothetical protein n=1 Tax=Clostridium sp. BL-8 TaxID=349938 RepID=UPI00098C19FE|nr:hypothetical protein [Clostridium sp. BL-8]OOM79841.1 hypothetical protein CLOBL_13750 [Clostridium sp. BL-8]